MQLSYTFSVAGRQSAIVAGSGWIALEGSTEPCRRCHTGPAIASIDGAWFGHICADCARLGGCPEAVIQAGLSAHQPIARIHGLTSMATASTYPARKPISRQDSVSATDEIRTERGRVAVA